VVASLTLESGLLVWVVAVAAWASGMPGISRRGVMAVTALVGVYALVRFVFIDVALEASPSGFLTQMLDPRRSTSDLVPARFGFTRTTS
jgi:hypothetical protein